MIVVHRPRRLVTSWFLATYDLTVDPATRARFPSGGWEAYSAANGKLFQAPDIGASYPVSGVPGSVQLIIDGGFATWAEAIIASGRLGVLKFSTDTLFTNRFLFWNGEPR